MRSAAVTITMVLALALGACGGKQQPANSTGVQLARVAGIPEDLTGVWKASIRQDDLEAIPPGLPEKSSVWTLKFLGTGGRENGPSVFVANDGAGEFAAAVAVSGRKMTLGSHGKCWHYRIEVVFSKLYFEPEDRSRCPTEVIGSVLTSGDWTRPGAPTSEQEWPPQRVREEGSPGEKIMLGPDLSARLYVVCDGPSFKCENDPPLRRPYQHVALEVTWDGPSQLFGVATGVVQPWVRAFGKGSVFVMDDPGQTGNPDGFRYRVLHADGSEVLLRLVMEPVPAVPGPNVVVVDYSSVDAVQHALLVDERARTLRPLDVPRNGDSDFAGRYWGPNPGEYLWFAYVNCHVFWIDGDALKSHRLCSDRSGFGWDRDDRTYVRREWFPDGWLEPGRMAVLERAGKWLTLHVSLNRGASWRRVRVRREAEIPDRLWTLVQYGTSLTIAKDLERMYHGGVRSKVEPCAVGRRVLLFEQQPGRDRELGVIRSGTVPPRGNFVGRPPKKDWVVIPAQSIRLRRGERIYALAPRERRTGYVCRAARSKVLRHGITND